MFPIIHFSGRFYFGAPRYNNDPAHGAARFYQDRPRVEVVRQCGCDPARYFDFQLLDVVVRQVTYADGTSATEGDPLLGMPMFVRGFLVDVAPSAICPQLHAGHLCLGDKVLEGRIPKVTASPLRKNIRNDRSPFGTLAAHFDAAVELAGPPRDPGSRGVFELAAPSTLELHLHLNRYNGVDAPPEEAASTGDVFGYLRPASREVEGEPRRRGRKLVTHPDLMQPGWPFETFLQVVPNPIPRWYPPWYYDIEGSYDLSGDGRLLALRYLDFVPYLDRSRLTPDVERYDVIFDAPAGRFRAGSFEGSLGEMQRTGGLVALRVPDGVDALREGRLSVEAVRDGASHPIVIETEWDLVLEGDRGFTLPSRSAARVTARVYRNNLPIADRAVRLVTQSHNMKSPIVARFRACEVRTGPDGRAGVEVVAKDLNAVHGVFDPGANLPTWANELPFDRYYGNYVYLVIENPLRHNPLRDEQTEVVEVAVRVLHCVDTSGLPPAPSFKSDIWPLFSYYARYYPWLHAEETDGVYCRFLDFENLEDMRRSAELILARLSLPDDDPRKMPRSRDFPVDGVALIRRWIETGRNP